MAVIDILSEGLKDRIAEVPEKPHGLGGREVWNKTTWLASWVLKIAQCFPFSVFSPKLAHESQLFISRSLERTLLCLATTALPPGKLVRPILHPESGGKLQPALASSSPSVVSTAGCWATKATDKQPDHSRYHVSPSFRDNVKTLTLWLEGLHLLVSYQHTI